MRKKILLSGLGGSLFPYLHEQLKHKYELYYVDSDKNLSKLYPNYNFFIAPLVIEESYWVLVEEIVNKYDIDFYIPLIDEEIIQAVNNFSLSKQVKVIAPTIAVAELCLNKYRLMEILSALNISFIKSATGQSFNSDISYPLFVKPIFGRGSRGIRKINNTEQLKAYYQLEGYKAEDVLIQEFVSGTEYTVGALCNNKNQLLYISSKRIIKKKGITQIAITENVPAINDIVKKIVDALTPCGPLNIQLYITNSGEIKIFEINPRFSTTTIMSYAAGIDEISLYIDQYDKAIVDNVIQPNTGITLHRRWENCFYNA